MRWFVILVIIVAKEARVHELSIAESICRSVTERVGAARIDDMVVEVGALSGVNRESLEFCLGEAARISGVRLDRFSVELVSAQAKCECGNSYEADDLIQPCPKCGGFSRSYTGGEDVVVSKLIMVEEDG